MSLRFNMFYPVLDTMHNDWQDKLSFKLISTIHLAENTQNINLEIELVKLIGSIRRTFPHSCYLPDEIDSLVYRALRILKNNGWTVDFNKSDRLADEWAIDLNGNKLFKFNA